MHDFRFLNSQSIAKADVYTARSGFRYGYIANLLYEDPYQRLVSEFPDVKQFGLVDKMSGGGRKRFFVGPVYNTGKDGVCTCRVRQLSPAWHAFLAECADPKTVALFHGHIGVSMNALCQFGLTYGSEGCVQEAHVDGAVREYEDSPIRSTWATIVYFNEEGAGPGATRIYGTDQKTVLFEAPSMRNGMFFFEQHPDAWHGFPPMPEGAERRILSLAYSNEQKPIYPRDDWGHRLTCRRFWRSALKK